MSSSNNPFRDPDFLQSVSIGSSASTREVTPGEPSTPHHYSNSQPSLSSPRPSDTLPIEAPVEELAREPPPAYTPAADVQQGEATLEFGPRRPFQQAPLHPPLRQNGYAPPLRVVWQNPQPSLAGWGSGFAGQVNRNASGSRRPPPPVHPSTRNSLRPRSAPTSPEPVSDFARDFYESDPSLFSIPGSDNIDPNEAPPPQPQSQPQPRFAPPPGRPPPQANADRSNDDDGRPTHEPVPGHPLLRNGKALVYPAGYECPKCHNTGYKNFDPTYPCMKCWDKYAKSFAGTLAYAPWNSSTSSSTNTRNTYQRPLPNFTPPQQTYARHRTTQSFGGELGSPVPPPGRPYGSSGSSTPTASYVNSIPLANGGVLPMTHLNNMQRPQGPSPSSATTITNASPSPGLIKLRPGDRRLGGHLCWRCGGSGTTSFLIFEESMCAVCKGIGRTY